MEYDIPYPKLYDNIGLLPREEIRNGGWLTTDGAHMGRVQWLRRYYPEQYQVLAQKYPEVKNYV